LGARLAVRGYRTLMLPSLTLEEAPSRLTPWLKQRTRWIKGYLQTWFVHMRSPRLLYRAFGLRGFIGFQCFVGLPALVFLTAPPVWTLTIINLASPTLMATIGLPNWFTALAGLNLASHFGLHWWQAYRINGTLPPIRPERLAKGILAFPLYWFLHSVASYRALWQLARNPHFWDKTDHQQLTAPESGAIFRTLNS
jgi:cellulose synthase/poly-beta-1,6-N-acetylglucosamine synthase-like glycosyltransferase